MVSELDEGVLIGGGGLLIISNFLSLFCHFGYLALRKCGAVDIRNAGNGKISKSSD